MATYRMKLGFRDSLLLGDQEYSFNAHVTGASTSIAWGNAEAIAAAFLETVMPTTVFLTLISVSNPDVVNGTLVIPQNSPGEREATGDPLPGWNATRLQLAGALGERLHTFFPRVGLTEVDVAGQTLTTTMQTAMADLVTGILTPGTLCDKDGAVFTYGAASARVQMRQMGWHRRHRPGYKRGWVPV